jgi:N-dimethylarginine dimethylaminohydrolase
MNVRQVRITGGPSPRDITLHLDGAKQESVSRIELVLDVHDAVRANVTYIAQVLFEGEATVKAEYRVEIKERRAAPGGEPGDVMWVTVMSATGRTQAEALRDLARQLDDQEREAISGQ